MNCETALDLLLEADLSELRGQGDSDLVRHLRTCPRCRERVERILARHAALGGALATVERLTPSNEAMRRARERARRRSGRGWRLVAPLALAAGLAVLLLVRREQIPELRSPRTLAPAGPAGALDVRVPAGRKVAVFQTETPNVVVIWSF